MCNNISYIRCAVKVKRKYVRYIAIYCGRDLQTSTTTNHPGPNQFLIPSAKYVIGKIIFCSMNRNKIGGDRSFQIVHCPYEG